MLISKHPEDAESAVSLMGIRWVSGDDINIDGVLHFVLHTEDMWVRLVRRHLRQHYTNVTVADGWWSDT